MRITVIQLEQRITYAARTQPWFTAVGRVLSEVRCVLSPHEVEYLSRGTRTMDEEDRVVLTQMGRAVMRQDRIDVVTPEWFQPVEGTDCFEYAG